MKVTRDKTENSQVFLTVEMEPAEVEAELEKSYHRLVKKAKVPGFRKGKAPRDVVERVLGKESLFDDALNYLIPQAYGNALKEQNIEAFAQSHIEVTKTDPVIFTATVPIKPTIELGDYHSIQVAEEPAKVTEEDINQAIDYLRHHHASWEPAEREVKFGDMVVFDVESTIEGQPFINQKGAQYQVVSGFTGPAPGFPEQLVGLKRDEEKEFKIQYPADHSRTELAGKEANFKVTVTEVKQEILPELNDDFALQVDPETKTIEALREKVTSNLKLQAEEKARRDLEERVLDAVTGQAKIEYPPVLVEMETNHLISEQLKRMGGVSFEQFLAGTHQTEEAVRGEVQPLAVKRVTRALVMDKVAEVEKIEVAEPEIDEEINNLTKGDPQNKEKLEQLFNTPRSRGAVRELLADRKTMQRLVEIARGNKTTG